MQNAIAILPLHFAFQLLHQSMPQGFTTTIHLDGQIIPVVILPALRRNGMHYEVNIPGYPRFFMRWSELDRYDIVNGEELEVPDNIVLAVNDIIEKDFRR